MVCARAILALQSIALLAAPVAVVQAQEPKDGRDPQPRVELDLRDSELPAAAKKGNFVAVPIPFHNPTLGSGLIGASAYFYPQTETQAQTQPATMTGFGAMYTSEDGRGAALWHDGYWKEDRWRFSGALAHADVTLKLLSLDQDSDLLRVDWKIRGTSLSSQLSRRVGNNWFVGITGRYIDVEQEFSLTVLSAEFGLPDAFETFSLGARLSYDTRDLPTNAFTGQFFEATASENAMRGSDVSYSSYSLAFRSYHSLSPSLVLAWQLGGCAVSDGVPLWDACNLELRGFATTDYMGKKSLFGQVEARWSLGARWGLVAFAGAGQVRDSFVSLQDGDVIPSYGLGLRFMVEADKRINMRLDYGRSTDSDSIYLSVGEAF